MRDGSRMSSLFAHDLSSGPYRSQSMRYWSRPPRRLESRISLTVDGFVGSDLGWRGGVSHALWREGEEDQWRIWARRRERWVRSGTDQVSGAGKWLRWCASLPEKDLCTGDSAFCRAVGDECPGWITRHGPRVDRWNLRTGEYLNWPCVTELPAGDGYELSPIPSRSHGTTDLPLGLPIAPRPRETKVVSIPGHTGMKWVRWFLGAANSGHTLPRVDTGSSCPDVHDSRPGDTARFLGSFVRSGHWFEDGTLRISSLILPGDRGNLARP